MVQLEEVKDSELNAAQPGPVSDEFEDDADFTDTGITPLWSTPPSALLSFKLFTLSRAHPAQASGSQMLQSDEIELGHCPRGRHDTLP